jgi:hypothetical protein
MWMHFDTGRIRRFNPNKVISKAKMESRSNDMRPEPMTQSKAYRIFQVVQDVNGIREPQIAIRRSNDRSRRGFI